MLMHAPMAPSHLLAATCPAGSGSVCQLVLDATGNEALARVADALVVTPAKILGIVLLALLAGSDGWCAGSRPG